MILEVSLGIMLKIANDRTKSGQTRSFDSGSGFTFSPPSPSGSRGAELPQNPKQTNMKTKPLFPSVPACLLAVVLIALGTTSPAVAASAPLLSAQISVRALTPQELKDYGL